MAPLFRQLCPLVREGPAPIEKRYKEIPQNRALAKFLVVPAECWMYRPTISSKASAGARPNALDSFSVGPERKFGFGSGSYGLVWTVGLFIDNKRAAEIINFRLPAHKSTRSVVRSLGKPGHKAADSHDFCWGKGLAGVNGSSRRFVFR